MDVRRPRRSPQCPNCRRVQAKNAGSSAESAMPKACFKVCDAAACLSLSALSVSLPVNGRPPPASKSSTPALMRQRQLTAGGTQQPRHLRPANHQPHAWKTHEGRQNPVSHVQGRFHHQSLTGCYAAKCTLSGASDLSSSTDAVDPTTRWYSLRGHSDDRQISRASVPSQVCYCSAATWPHGLINTLELRCPLFGSSGAFYSQLLFLGTKFLQ